MKLHIKNMMCSCCKQLVLSELTKLGIDHSGVKLGEVEVGSISGFQRQQLTSNLQSWGLELMDDKKAILIEKVKNAIIEAIHSYDESTEIDFAEHLEKTLQYDYTYIANQFSKITGISIRQFIIEQKIERVKELLVYDELPLKEIAYMLHYSSLAHLSHQFKAITGEPPSIFKRHEVDMSDVDAA